MEQRQREEFLQFLWNHFVQAEPRNIFKESLFYVRKYRGAPRKEGGTDCIEFRNFANRQFVVPLYDLYA